MNTSHKGERVEQGHEHAINWTYNPEPINATDDDITVGNMIHPTRAIFECQSPMTDKRSSVSRLTPTLRPPELWASDPEQGTSQNVIMNVIMNMGE